jgi:hypothetical protein
MNEDLTNLSDGPDFAPGALEAAIERLREATDGILSGGGEGPLARALGEALFWVGSLDQHFSAQHEAYWASRGLDARGRAVGGLVFARNQLAHGLTSAGAIRFEVFPPTFVREGDDVAIRWARIDGRDYGSPNRGSPFAVQPVWVDLETLPPASGPQHDRDVWYRELVSARPLLEPLESALSWFRDLHARGLEEME